MHITSQARNQNNVMLSTRQDKAKTWIKCNKTQFFYLFITPIGSNIYTHCRQIHKHARDKKLETLRTQTRDVEDIKNHLFEFIRMHSRKKLPCEL